MDRKVDLCLESMITAPVKDERVLTEFPFFSIEKRKRMKPLVYDDGQCRIEINPSPWGLATIWDKDVLIYVISLLNERIEKGLPLENRRIVFKARDCLKTIGRGVGGKAYLDLDAAFNRLKGTVLKTTIKAGGVTEKAWFGWVDSARAVTRELVSGKEVMERVEVVLCDWMWRAVTQDRRVLTINPAYFQLSGGSRSASTNSPESTVARRAYGRSRCPAWPRRSPPAGI